MGNGLTPAQASYPVPQDFVALACRWRPDAIDSLFDYVWRGFYKLIQEGFRLDMASENLERGISQQLCLCIDEVMAGTSFFTLIHQPYEDELHSPPPASPKAPDLAFFLRGDPKARRASLPLEAKILGDDADTNDYVKDLKANFLGYRYAPFSSQGGMLGYLLSGKAVAALSSIEASLGCELEPHPAFANRGHALSRHLRPPPPCSAYPRYFRCHHLIMLFS